MKSIAAIALVMGLAVGATGSSSPTGSAFPTSLDWRLTGFVTSVKNQGQCGASWAFAATAVLEAAVKRNGGSLLNLSEQQLVDCSGSHANQGCNGGHTKAALDYVHSHGLLTIAAHYPYTARQGSCKAVTSGVGVKAVHEVADDDGALLAAVDIQPVAVEIHADLGFQALGPTSGVYPCVSGTPNLWVTIIGYGTDALSGKNYWLIRNSLGTSWGNGGYARIERRTGCREIHGAVYPDAR